MRFLTDFADQAVILPLVAMVGVVLVAQGWRRGGAAWLAAIGATFAVMLALKLLFLGCVAVFGPADLRSPSGHVAAAAVVSGGVAAIFGRGWRSVAAIALAAGFAIGGTRLGLRAHSWPEVILGAGIGLAGALALRRLAGPAPPLRPRPLILAAAVVLALFHGRHLEAEIVIRQAAAETGLLPPWCQPNHGIAR